MAFKKVIAAKNPEIEELYQQVVAIKKGPEVIRKMFFQVNYLK